MYNRCALSPEITHNDFLMDLEAARTARESLELVFQMSNILDTGLDRHTLSVLVALCDVGLNPESLAAVVKEFQRESPHNASTSDSLASTTGTAQTASPFP
ncbi:hypothetical protein M9H77_04661 [Catharanthus roseus]|uniref:Uncharacterized protein n=1 Tax=Catharanthus roseus TaxID=4058 RepID=A0ACC0CF45_CATRO|nr:hypothetical protein M9H77_04661 [Catharanthus roseus]